jgi:Pathogenicity locus
MKRNDIKQFRDIPNVGLAIEKDFLALGLEMPTELIGKDPYQLYSDLCKITQKRHDPCVIDVFISAVRYMEGGPLKKWWEFTKERKKHLSTYQ